MPYYLNAITGELDLTVIAGNILTDVTADVGTASPVGNNLNVFGDAPQGIQTIAGGDTLTITAFNASDIQKGMSELATDPEAIAGTDSTRTIVPTSLKAKLGSQTDKSMPYGQGDTNALGWTNALADGQIAIGSSLGTPQAANLTSSAGTIAISNSPNVIDLDVGGSVLTMVTAEDGSTCVPVANNLNIVGTATNGINTHAAGDTLTIGMSSPFVGNFTFENNTAATPRFISVENNDTDPGSYACVSISTEPAGGDPYIFFEIDSATRYYSLGVDNSVAGDPLVLTNNVNPSTGDALISTTSAGVITLFNDLDVTEGGTGVSTLTSHGILMGNGAGDIQATAEPTDGQLLIGKTGNFPVLATLTDGTGITITEGSGSITIAAAGSVATSYDGNSGTAIPSANNLDILGATATGGTATNIVTSGATNVMSIALKNSISQPLTNAAGTEGMYSLDNRTFLHNYGSAGIGSHNTYLGISCGNLTNTGSFNTIVGSVAAWQITSGIRNSIFGTGSSASLTSGSENSIFGYNSFGTASTAEKDCCFGVSSGGEISSGLANCCFGHSSGYFLKTGNYNSFFGFYSGFNMSGSDNTGIGNQACRGGNAATSTGQFNVGVGSTCLYQLLSGSENCAIGISSLEKTTTGSYNCGLGIYSLKELLTGNYNIACGKNSGTSYTGAESSNITIQNTGVVGESNTIRIGTQGAGNQQENRCFISGITGVSVSNTALVTLDTSTGQLGSKTIANLPAWKVITADQTAVVGEGYFCNKAGLLSLTLPAASAVGDIIEVSNINTAIGIKIVQGAGQQIFKGVLSSTLGIGGSLTSIAIGDSLKLVCRVADTFWQVVSSEGAWTIV